MLRHVPKTRQTCDVGEESLSTTQARVERLHAGKVEIGSLPSFAILRARKVRQIPPHHTVMDFLQHVFETTMPLQSVRVCAEA